VLSAIAVIPIQQAYPIIIRPDRDITIPRNAVNAAMFAIRDIQRNPTVANAEDTIITVTAYLLLIQHTDTMLHKDVLTADIMPTITRQYPPAAIAEVITITHIPYHRNTLLTGIKRPVPVLHAGISPYLIQHLPTAACAGDIMIFPNGRRFQKYMRNKDIDRAEPVKFANKRKTGLLHTDRVAYVTDMICRRHRI
jgi:hypothetical protein